GRCPAGPSAGRANPGPTHAAPRAQSAAGETALTPKNRSAAMSWFAVQTMPRAEDRARDHLKRQNYETYLPRLRKRRRHARRVDTVLRPLFPGYLFVSFDPSRDPWRAINSTIGVIRLVGFGDVLVPVPDKVIEGLRSLEDDKGIIVGAGPKL